MDKDIAIAIQMAIDGQRDFGTKVIEVLIAITKSLPEENRTDVANKILELLQEHKAGLEDMKHLHEVLHKKADNGQ